MGPPPRARQAGLCSPSAADPLARAGAAARPPNYRSRRAREVRGGGCESWFLGPARQAGGATGRARAEGLGGAGGAVGRG